jgi:beta-1,2-mannobiose phosphorylase / 1,2-beta-oligomannan phosphorylase
MIRLKRSIENPVLIPNSQNQWEAKASFNPSVVKVGDRYHAVYRALSDTHPYLNHEMQVSTIGYAYSDDPIHFRDKKQLIKPQYDWEKFGCEDPRVTKIDDTFYIFYTALSTYPFTADGIRVAVATTKDFNTIDTKAPVTTFNAKSMVLFPEKINDQYVAMLSVDTDKPPAKVSIAYFDSLAQITDPSFWDDWYAHLDDHRLDLLRDSSHQVEVGAVPIKTHAGWLLIYAYIKEYFTPDKVFGIEAVLLDLNDPSNVLARTSDSLLAPREEYELFGMVPYTIFPSGSLLHHGELFVYYGAADTTAAVASCNLKDLLSEMMDSSKPEHVKKAERVSLTRFEGNPIITPNSKNNWENKAAFNPAALYLDNKVHILYRAMGDDDTSVVGYATSSDGRHIDERLPEPIYVPRADFEVKKQSGNSGCEDARLTLFGDTIYMCYTAYNAVDKTHVAMTHIEASDFLARNWNWSEPIVISPREVNDKNACLLPEKVQGNYALFHRTNHIIWVDYVKDLNFDSNEWVQGNILFGPKEGTWYSEKVGIAAPPIKTKDGWLLIFHALSHIDLKYRLGAMLLNLHDPLRIVSMLDYPILEPEEEYEMTGIRGGTVFACGATVVDGELLVYYGGGDTTVGGASIELEKLLSALKKNR